VVVVDVDRYGVQLVRDLRTVFPGLKVIAVAQGPRTRAAATKAGATVAVPASTSAAALRALAVRLATRP
jgi:uroporphyrinogen-III synthase